MPRTSPSQSARPWLVFAAVTLPMFALMIDFYGIVVVLPTIGADLGASTAELAWVLNAFALANGALIIAAGRLADLWGRRRMLLAGTSLFGVLTIVAGLAPSTAVLVAARAGQGVACAMFVSSSLAVLTNAFPPERRTLAIGLWGGIGGIGSAIGPLVGGAVTEWLDWRAFFFVNVPIVLVALVLTVVAVPETRDTTTTRVDWRGAVLISVGLIGVTFALQQSADEPLGSRALLGALVAGLACLVAFAVVERRTAEPLVDFRLFRSLAYFGSAAVAFCANWAFGVVMFVITLYLQNVLDTSPLETGLLFIVFSIPFALTGAGSGKIAAWIGLRATMAIGMVLVTAGAVAFLRVEGTDGLTLVVVGLGISGLGQGLAYNVSTSAAMAAIPVEKAGVASGMINTIRMVGVTLGVAVTTIVLNTVETGRAADHLARLGRTLTPEEQADLQGLLAGSDQARDAVAELTPAARSTVEALVADAFSAGMHAGMLITVALSAIAVPLALLGRRAVPDATDPAAEDERPGALSPAS